MLHSMIPDSLQTPAAQASFVCELVGSHQAVLALYGRICPEQRKPWRPRPFTGPKERSKNMLVAFNKIPSACLALI